MSTPADDVRKDWAVPVPKRERCSNASCRKPCKPSEVVHGEKGEPFCSASCGSAKEEGLTAAALRRQVFLRDGGRCASCGLEAEQLRAEIDGLAKDAAPQTGVSNVRSRLAVEARVHQLIRLGFDRHAIESGSSFWQADHIEPSVLSGHSTLANARTLCIPCHRKATGDLASSRASRRPFKRGR